MKIKSLDHSQMQCLRVIILVLSILSTTLAFAYDFEVDGIYYLISGSNASVTNNGFPYGNGYAGDVIIPSTVTYNGVTYSVTSIGGYAFDGCNSLTSVTIPNSVKQIGYRAFYSCSLTSITIPNSVTNIDELAFAACHSLADMTIPNSVISIAYNALDDTPWFNNQPDGLVYVGSVAHKYKGTMPNGTYISLRDGTYSISQYAFSGCSGLTSITIPNSVTTIRESAFDGCSSLKNVYITDIEAWCNIILGNASANPLCSSGKLYLNGSELTDLTIPSSVTSIGRYAFYRCSNLASVTIPNSVTSIETYAFSGSGLTNVTIPNSIITINDYVFSNCTGLKNIKLPKTLKSIGNYAFSSCSSLTSVTIPNSVTTIGNNAFSASGLTNITIPNSVTNIGNSAFRNCDGLKSATVTSHLTSLGEYAFSGCSALSSFTCMPETPPIHNNSNSFGTYNTTSLYVPRSGVENYKTHTNWRRFAKIYEYVGYFSVPDVNVSKGKTVVVPVLMTNEADIIGFQTDIYLPEGFEFVKDGADYVVDPSDRMARDHSIMCNVSDDGALRVLCYSPTNKVISGNEGELFYVTIKAPADTVGDFSLCFKNTILTTSDAEELLSPDTYTNINVIPYLPGDANGNGEVSVIDIVTSAQYIIFQNPDPFLFEAADLNNDDQITVTDLALIANLILYPTMSAPKHVPAFDLSDNRIDGNDIQLNVGETRTVTITLDNLDEYSAFQMDVKLPNGVTASNFNMSNQSGSHSFITSEQMNEVIRLLCYSPSLAALDNDEKALLTFDVTATGNIGGNIIIDGIELVTTTCQPVYLDAFAISVNQSSLVNEISSGKSVAQIEYYNLAGQKLAEPAQGVTIVVATYTDGSRSTQKVIK